MVYKIKRPRVQQLEFEPVKGVPEDTFEDAEIQRVQGKMPGSVQEYRVAMALTRMKIDFDFQVPLFGGHERGGYIVDFVVYNPFAQPLEVQSERWHTGRFGGDQGLRAKRISDYYERDLVEVYVPDLTSIDEAIIAVKRVLFGPPVKLRYV